MAIVHFSSNLMLTGNIIVYYLLYLLLVIDCCLHHIVMNCTGKTSEDDLERLNKLAAFQKKALAHAFSCELAPPPFFKKKIIFLIFFRAKEKVELIY